VGASFLARAAEASVGVNADISSYECNRAESH